MLAKLFEIKQIIVDALEALIKFEFTGAERAQIVRITLEDIWAALVSDEFVCDLCVECGFHDECTGECDKLELDRFGSW